MATTTDREGGRARALLAVLVGLLALVPFLPALAGDFLTFDDVVKLRDNPHYRGLGWPQLRWMWTTGHTGLYQPLAWMSWGLDHLLWGPRPAGYHLTSLLCHALAVALVALLARRLLELAPAGRAASPAALTAGGALAALAFGLHPLRAEPVAWISARGDVLAGALVVAATLAYLRACRAAGAGGSAPPGRLALAAGLFGLALLAKSSALLWPLALLVLDVYPLDRLGRATGGWLTPAAGRRYLEKTPLLLVAAALAGVAARTKADTDSMLPPEAFAPVTALARGLYSAAFYVRATFVPGPISPLYERPGALDALALPFLLSALAVLGITLAAGLLRRRWPALLAAWLAYLLLLAPSSGLVPYGSQLVAARYSYVACLPWAVLVGAAAPWLARLVRSGRLRRGVAALAAAAAVAALGALGLRTWELAHVWADSERLWRHTLAVTPGSALAHIELGLLAERRGDADGAEAHFRRASELWPGRIRHVAMAQAFEAEGNHAVAAAHYRRALRLYPESRGIRLALGRALSLAGRPAEAVPVLREAAERFPDSVDARLLLGVALEAHGQRAAAIEAFRAAVRLEPGSASAHYNLAVLLDRQGDRQDAVAHLERALALEPGLERARTLRERMRAAPEAGAVVPPAPRGPGRAAVPGGRR